MRRRSLVAGLLAGLASIAVAGTATADPVAPYVIGGDDADQEYSFMVSLQDGGSHFCGGSLIAPEWVLTAAHCVAGASPEQVSLRIGSTDRTQGGETADAADLITHPDYGSSAAGADIALVKLAAPATSAPVTLADSAEPGTASRIIGWGQTCPASGCDGAPQILQQLDTQVVESSACTGIDGAVELCTDNPNGDSGACYGDSGGPQIVADGAGWKLIGATSRAGNNDSTCATGPSIYTSVPAYADWIATTIG